MRSIFDHNGMKLEINNGKKTQKIYKYVEIKQHTLEEQITREIRIHFEMNENENIIYQNMRYTTKAMLREKFIAINTYIKKEERSQMKSLT